MSDSMSPRALTRRKILVFTKYPHPGFAKTRLIPLLGEEGAAAVSRTLSERTIQTVQDACMKGDASPIVFYATKDDSDENVVREWLRGLGPELTLRRQCSGDLGDRLRQAFRESFERLGTEQVLVVGVDIPELSTSIIDSAYKGLEKHDVVIGPAVDGFKPNI